MITTMRRAVLVALALTAGAFGTARAQLKVEAEASTFFGGTWFLTDPPGQFALHTTAETGPLYIENGTYRDGVMAGVNAGLRFADRFGVEGFFAWIPTRLSAGSGLDAYGGRVDANSYMYGGSFLYHFTQLDRFQPFVGVGVGGETMSYDPASFERHSSFQGNGLVGANYWITDGFGLRFDARDCLSSWESKITGVENTAENDLMLSVGLNFKGKVFGR
jgi:outer membrane protein W